MMDSTYSNSIYIYKKPIIRDPIPDDLLANYWFLPARELSGTFQTPGSLYRTNGFKLSSNLIHSIIYTRSEKEMMQTDADAILTEFRIVNRERKLKRAIAISDRPIIVSLKKGIKKVGKIINEAKMYEQTGASAVLVSSLISTSVLEQIRRSVKLPVISKSYANLDNIVSKHNAGADMICIMGMEISGILVDEAKKLIPDLPILSFAGISEELIANSLSARADAIIYKPWIHVNYFT